MKNSFENTVSYISSRKINEFNDCSESQKQDLLCEYFISNNYTWSDILDLVNYPDHWLRVFQITFNINPNAHDLVSLYGKRLKVFSESQAMRAIDERFIEFLCTNARFSVDFNQECLSNIIGEINDVFDALSPTSRRSIYEITDNFSL